MKPSGLFKRAFVVGAYEPGGGNLMAYHLGRILECDFGLQAFAVADENWDSSHGIYDYKLVMPLVSNEDMENTITDSDVLVLIPRYFSRLYGWRIPGFKICYVQGFTTFQLIDRRLDRYVAVSDFVSNFLKEVYGIEGRTIPPFIDLEALPPRRDWIERPANVIQPYRKSAAIFDLALARLNAILIHRAPHIQIAEALGGDWIPRRDLLTRVAAVRYFLTLSPAEGFGLLPLEAMAVGTTVVGFDGYGGRHYMRSGENCAVARYTNIEQVAELLIHAVGDAEYSAGLASQGTLTARAFSYEIFRQAWITEFSIALGMNPIPVRT